MSESSPVAGERLVYVREESLRSGDDEIDLIDLFNTLWQGKWFVIGICAIFAVCSMVYALTATEWYRAEVLLVPVDGEVGPGMAGQLLGLGGLSSLAGLSFGGGGNTESIAVLRSRDFAREFIEDNDLLPVLLAEEWNVEAGRWKAEDPADQPDVRDAIQYFGKNVLKVSEDNQTSLVTLSIEWIDPEIAAKWADALVARLNEGMRQRALAKATDNVAYLQKELTATNVVTLRQSIGSLLQTELEKLMMARGNEEFAFRVVDAAQVPKERERPKRTSIVVFTTVLGGMVSVFLVFAWYRLNRTRSLGGDSDETVK